MSRFDLVRLLARAVGFFVSDKRKRQMLRDRVIRFFIGDRTWYSSEAPHHDPLELASAAVTLQDQALPRTFEEATKAIIIVVPEINLMNGGVYSLFSIATELRRQRQSHCHEVIVVTIPRIAPITYFRNTHFTNSENVFRFSQLARCKKLNDVLLLLPEYSVPIFLEELTAIERTFLENVPHLRINLVTQNLELMPEPAVVAKLRTLTEELTQTVAHHSYFNQEVADRWGLPTLLLPAFTDLSSYPPLARSEKQKLIIYSPDEAPYKKDVLATLAKELPDFRLQEIRGLTFDEYMGLATRCMFSVTFGEGFDGYFAQPIQQGGLSFAVFNDKFFPSRDAVKHENVFATPTDMTLYLPKLMRELSEDEQRYRSLNAIWIKIFEELYNQGDYRRRIERLVAGDFDIRPQSDVRR